MLDNPVIHPLLTRKSHIEFVTRILKAFQLKCILEKCTVYRSNWKIAYLYRNQYFYAQPFKSENAAKGKKEKMTWHERCLLFELIASLIAQIQLSQTKVSHNFCGSDLKTMIMLLFLLQIADCRTVHNTSFNTHLQVSSHYSLTFQTSNFLLLILFDTV